MVPDWAARADLGLRAAGLLDALTEHWARAGDPDTLHVERFVPPTPVADGATGGRVSFTTSGIAADAGPGTPLMAAGEAAGALLPNGCRMGICHTCVGSCAPARSATCTPVSCTTPPAKPSSTCVSGAAGDVEIEL